ncbi:MAG: hypothetical protein IJ301_01115 [Clostridia bacterium]|nr:hypothetical protein [Clostridia bacterium]
MQKDYELLTSLYQNCQTAIQSIRDIESAVENEELRAELREELEHYQEFAEHCKNLASDDNPLPDNNFFEKARLWTSIKMTTLTDKSTRHLAEMMLLGTVMGTLQCYKDLSDYREANKELLELCSKLLQMEESHFNYLKMFLQKDI